MRPHLDYCVQAWRPHYRMDIDKLEKVQRRTMKMVEGLEGYSYSDRLRILGLTTLETRFLRADLIEVLKILKGFENVDPGKFFQVVVAPSTAKFKSLITNHDLSFFLNHPTYIQ